MAASIPTHAESETTVSFDENQSEQKTRRRKQPYVKVTYDSGSDADAESGDENDEITAKRAKLIKPRAKSKKPRASDDDDDNGPASSDEDEGDSEQVEPGAGWADAMAKILRNEAPEEKVVLSKSKDYAKKKEEEKQQYVKIRKEREEHKDWENLYRVKPQVTEREFKRGLQRTATRGVVQLFNAVKKQQKFLEDKLKETGSETKRIEIEASISKGDFLDLLKGQKKKESRREMRHLSTKKKDSSTSKAEEKDKPMWSVLREDFMMGAKMKDWDKAKADAEDKAKGKPSKR